MIALDETDRALVRALARDMTRSAGALGRELGLSQPACWRRIKRLREAGVFRGARLDLDAEALGFGVTVFLGVKLAIASPDRLGDRQMLDAYHQKRIADIRARVAGITLLNRTSMISNPLLRDARARALDGLYTLKPVRKTLMHLGLGAR